METLLTSTGSKYAAPSAPLYPGDLINNIYCYHPIPNFDEKRWKRLALNAEGFVQDSSRAKSSYDNIAMLYCSVSSGYAAYREIENGPTDKILRHSLRFTGDEDKPFLTVQRSGDVLDGDIFLNSILEPNYHINRMASEKAAGNMRDFYIAGPADREAHLRTLQSNPSILRGDSYEDSTFEMNFWGLFCLMDVTRGIYYGDHAWSRNAPQEKAVGLALQYGQKKVLGIRSFKANFTVTDINGDPISVVDQAWEDARQILDVTQRKVMFEEQEYGFRTETSVALLITRFMYDHMYRSNHNLIYKKAVDPVVQGHYKNKDEQARMQALFDHMAPYIANYCDWPTLRRVIDFDPHLKSFYDQHIIPKKSELKPVEETTKFVFSYLPKGGFDHPDLRKKGDLILPPKSSVLGFNLAGKQPRPQGIQEKPFHPDWDPKLFDDGLWRQIGENSHPDLDANMENFSFDQNAAIMIVNAYRDGRPPLNAPNRLLYLDDSASGLRAADYIQKHNIKNPGEVSLVFDKLARGGDSFYESLQSETAEHYMERIHEIANDHLYGPWRQSGGIGSIISLSDINASVGKYQKRREGLNAEYHEGIAAHGSMVLPGKTSEAIARRLIDLDVNGVIIPQGELTGKQFRYITEGVLAALGQTPRSHSGGKYRFEFFYDKDLNLAPQDRTQNLEKLDFLDLYIMMGLKVQNYLTQSPVPLLRDEYVSMARMSMLYELMIDPGRVNKNIMRNGFSGKDTEEHIIDLNQVDDQFLETIMSVRDMPKIAANDDPYQDFFHDEIYKNFATGKIDQNTYLKKFKYDHIAKAQLAYRIWAWMSAERIKLSNGADAPVSGNLRARGIAAFTKEDLRDLKEEDGAAFKWWHDELTEKQRINIFDQGQLKVYGPGFTNK